MSCVIIIFNDLDICIKYLHSGVCQDITGQPCQLCTHWASLKWITRHHILARNNQSQEARQQNGKHHLFLEYWKTREVREVRGGLRLSFPSHQSGYNYPPLLLLLLLPPYQFSLTEIMARLVKEQWLPSLALLHYHVRLFIRPAHRTRIGPIKTFVWPSSTELWATQGCHN